MSDSSSFTLTPPAAAPRAPSRGAFVLTIRRGGVTMALRCPPASLALNLAERLMSGTVTSVQASAQADRGGAESEQFESAARETDEGLVSDFLIERTESAQQFWEPVATLSAAYLKWCRDRGQEPLSPCAFGQELRNLTFRQGRSRRIKCGKSGCPKCAGRGGHQERTWEGLRLKTSDGAALALVKPSEGASQVQ